MWVVFPERRVRSWEEDYLGKGEGKGSVRDYLEEGETMMVRGEGVYLDGGRGERTLR